MDVLHLLFPQWQGSGSTNELYYGAKLLQKRLGKYKFVEIKVPEIEELHIEHDILGYSSIFSQLTKASVFIDQVKPKKIFMIGGGCDVEIVPVSYLNNIYNGNLIVFWFDAHGDLNTPESSPSKNFHGMPLRLLLAEGDKQLINLVVKPLKLNQIVLVGTRELDSPEKEYLRKNRMTITKLSEIKNLLNHSNLDNVYIHLDLDVLNPDVYPTVKCPTPGGLLIEDIRDLISMIKNAKNLVGGSVIEYVSGKSQTGLDIAADFYRSLVEAK